MNTKQAIEHVLKGKRNGMRVPATIAAGVPLARLGAAQAALKVSGAAAYTAAGG